MTTTPILADLTRQVAGDRADIHSLVPSGADPHSYEPSLRNVRSVVYADVAFSNYLMLEQHSVIKILDTNLRKGVPNVSLAEASTTYGAEPMQLVENANLDAIWLGLRVRGKGSVLGANRASEVNLSVTAVEGPGTMAAYLTETFGRPRVFADSSDGFDAGSGYEHDSISLPADAHTHMSWAFSSPGVYTVRLQAKLRVDTTSEPVELGEGKVTFAVGQDPRQIPQLQGFHVLDAGHADIAVDLDKRDGGSRLSFVTDGAVTDRSFLDTVVWVPPKVLTEIPASPAFRFLGKPGAQTYQLPQAVLGAHVHGEIDPHLWLSVRNAKAYVQVIRDTLISIDPAGESGYRTRAAAYLQELTNTDDYVAHTISTVPPARRQLVTTHDAYGYFARDYGLNVAGFAAPNPAVEPSLAARRKVSSTIRELKVPAVFLEPHLGRQSAVLSSIAADAGVIVCPIRSDTLDASVPNYIHLMRSNADSIADCLNR